VYVSSFTSIHQFFLLCEVSTLWKINIVFTWWFFFLFHLRRFCRNIHKGRRELIKYEPRIRAMKHQIYSSIWSWSQWLAILLLYILALHFITGHSFFSKVGFCAIVDFFYLSRNKTYLEFSSQVNVSMALDSFSGSWFHRVIASKGEGFSLWALESVAIKSQGVCYIIILVTSFFRSIFIRGVMGADKNNNLTLRCNTPTSLHIVRLFIQPQFQYTDSADN
jgi:hypothetical protein